MGQNQIEKVRKKKGRPSKADLAARKAAQDREEKSLAGAPSPENREQREVRRSLRRRSFRYNIIDYDEDYLDDDVLLFEEDDVEEREDDDVEEDEDEEEEEERRREKKLKLVVKLHSSGKKSKNSSSSIKKSTKGASRGRVESGRKASRHSESEEEEEEEEQRREVKKRRINADDDDVEVDNDDEDNENENEELDDEVVDDGKGESKRGDSVPGTPTYNRGNNSSVTPLPDKKQLELILDKLQKKDTYGVYAEPVDPEELPDYHDIIKHPMDFSTVRKKLANGSYSTLEQFESDVFLISSNAMQYNGPETIYHKQARAIKELAERKFQRVRIQIERLEKEPKSEPKSEPKCELKSEQRDRPNSLVKKQFKKPFCRSTQEPVGSDFSSGATLATTDAHNSCIADHLSNIERPSNNVGPVEGIASLADNNTEKVEDPQSGKGTIPKFGRRSFVVDENRRATYNISSQPVDSSELIFTPFEDEKKQLIPVGLPGEYSYARSLARFAASLGPNAWRIASKRIEQVLPPGFNYGRGWIGEYEPLPTAVLVVERQKEYPLNSRSDDASESGRNNKRLDRTALANAHLPDQPRSEGKLAAIFGSGGARQPTPAISVSQQKDLLCRGLGGPENMMVKRVESNCLPTNNQRKSPPFQQQNRLPRDSVSAENMSAKRVEPNSPPVSYQKKNHIVQRHPPRGAEMGGRRTESNSPSVSSQSTDHTVPKQLPNSMDMPASKPAESISKGKNFLHSLPFKQPDANGGAPEGLHNGKSINNSRDSNRVIISTSGLSPSQAQLAGAAASFPQRHDQGLSDPVLVMKMMTEKAQKQQNGSATVHSTTQTRPSVPSPRGDSGSNAAAAAASAWMSAGTVGFRPAFQNPAASRGQISADPLCTGMWMFYPQAMQPRAEYPVSGAMHSQPDKRGLPFQSFVPQPIKVSNEQVQNRPTVFPQMVANDLSRFQMQAPWHGLSPNTQQKQKQDSLPPDLNVAFQSVDSQQPDLALQL